MLSSHIANGYLLQANPGRPRAFCQSGLRLKRPLTFWHRAVTLWASTLSWQSAGTLCLQLFHCLESPAAVSGCSCIFHHIVAISSVLCLALPRMPICCWFTLTFVVLLTPEFSFEIKDSVSVQCFCATNFHLENSFEGKFVSSSRLWAPRVTCWHALPKGLSQLCSNRAEAGKEKCQVSLLVL